MCHVLANLCVLQLYNHKTLPCMLFKDIQKQQKSLNVQAVFYKEESWKLGLPWLYYLKSPQFVFKYYPPVDLVVSFSAPGKDATRTNKLKFWLARYSIKSDFEAFLELTDDLSLCPMDMKEVY